MGYKAKKGYTTPNRQGEYARLAKLLPKAIEELERLLAHPNCNVRMGAVNTVLDKCLPDLKAVDAEIEISKQPVQLFINAGSGFLPPNLFDPSEKRISKTTS